MDFAVWPKPRDNQKKQKIRPMDMVGRGHRSELCVLFCFLLFLFFCSLDKTSRKPKKKQKKIDPWTGSGERPGRGHGSELFGSFGFSMFFWQFGLGGAGVQIVETRIF